MSNEAGRSTDSRSLGPWVLLLVATLLLLIDVFGFFLSYFVVVPAMAATGLGIALAVRRTGRPRLVALAATMLSILAGAISALFLVLGSSSY